MTGSLLLSAPFLLFTLALLCMLLIAIAESLGSSVKLSPSAWLEARLPQVIRIALQHIGVDRLPIVYVALLFLLSAGLTGYLVQFIWFATTDQFAPLLVIILPVVVLATLFTIVLSHWLTQLMRHPPFYVQPEPNLLGRIATICRGDARPGLSAQARVRDQLGHLHYIEVEPEFGELQLYSEVILVSKLQHHYLAKSLPKDNHLFD